MKGKLVSSEFVSEDEIRRWKLDPEEIAIMEDMRSGGWTIDEPEEKKEETRGLKEASARYVIEHGGISEEEDAASHARSEYIRTRDLYTALTAEEEISMTVDIAARQYAEKFLESEIVALKKVFKDDEAGLPSKIKKEIRKRILSARESSQQYDKEWLTLHAEALIQKESGQSRIKPPDSMKSVTAKRVSPYKKLVAETLQNYATGHLKKAS